jgi:hypothetical protein
MYKVAEGAITPGDFVKIGTADYQVVANTTTGLMPAGVADLNYDAIADGEDPLTHDFAAGDECIVITRGRVRVVAGPSAMTAGVAAMVDTTTGTDCEDLTATAAQASDTYKTANLDLIADEIRTTVGMILGDAAKTVAGVIDLRL